MTRAEKSDQSAGTDLGRLTPEMVSFRGHVLAFVREYIAKWGHSPSYGEIAAALETGKTRVKRSVNSLVKDGLLLKTKGVRGLKLPSSRESAIRTLQELGWKIEDGSCAPPRQAGTKTTLLPPPSLDYPSRRSQKAAKGGDNPAKRKSR